MKYLLTLLFTINLLNASMLLDSTNTCIEAHYSSGGKFYYQRTSDLAWIGINADNLASTVLYNYTYDSENDICSSSGANSLGLLPTQYNFLMGLTALFFTTIVSFTTIKIFIRS